MSETNIELTPEQIEQRREKSRAKRAKQRAKKEAPQTQEQQSPAAKQNTQKKPQDQRVRLTDEEYIKQQLEFKSKKIEMNPKDSVVSIAESSEAKTLAYNVNEVNAIAEYVRNNMGSKVSLDVGVMLIKTFQEGVTKTIDEYIKLANSHGIGSRRALALYREAQAKEKNRAVAQELFKNKTIENETPEETKEREIQEKALEKATQEFEKAKEAVTRALDAMKKADELKLEALSIFNDGFEKRGAAQKERKQIEAEKAKIEKEKAKETDAAA